jgi:hypothetical protein
MKMFRFWLYCFLALFSGCAVVPAFSLDVKIEGPTEAAPGDLVVLTAKADGAKNYSWMLANSDKTYLPVEGGLRAIFSSGLKPGEKAATYIFVLAASDESSLGTHKHVLTIKYPGPSPDPEPGPTPDPDPEPEPLPPAPIPGDGLRVLIVYESGEMTKYPIETQVILAGADVREFLNKNCVAEDIGNGKKQPGYRIYDQDLNIGGDLEIWKQAMTRDRKELPWVVISNGKTGYEGPLPKGPTEFLELCKQYLPK